MHQNHNKDPQQASSPKCKIASVSKGKDREESDDDRDLIDVSDDKTSAKSSHSNAGNPALARKKSRE